MDSVLHGIGALPGDGRYAVTFRRADGSEQTAVVHVTADDVDVPEASLPTGWTRSSPAFAATVDAVRAFEIARSHAAAGTTLRDVAGGWDVSLGNVVLGDSGGPTCTAHGAMTEATDGLFVCAECDAQAVLA